MIDDWQRDSSAYLRLGDQATQIARETGSLRIGG
jgi:hypothetical protein